MPIARRYFINSAIGLTIAMLLAIFIVPTSIRLMLLLAWIFLLLMIGLAYYHNYHQVLVHIKMLDRNENFQEEVDYLSAVNQKGYDSFVFDTYGIYAYYMLGDFTAYENIAMKMSRSKQWRRPTFKEFRDKVKDNLECIRFLRNWSDSGLVNYSGTNVLIIQSLSDYHQGNLRAIQSRMEAYPKQPPLKQVCLYCLAHQFERLEGFYIAPEAKTILENIKGRELNGKSKEK